MKYFIIASILIIITLVTVIIYLCLTKKKSIPFQVNVPSSPIHYQIKNHRDNVPEFRGPPIKRYKPGRTQQMGVLIGQNEEILPLYGKESRLHRDRYNYYTTTGGENLYPVPVIYKNRDCMDDIGCNELHDTEQVKVLGKNNNYTVNIYKNIGIF
jgi:hypothetical protein